MTGKQLEQTGRAQYRLATALLATKSRVVFESHENDGRMWKTSERDSPAAVLAVGQ